MSFLQKIFSVKDRAAVGKKAENNKAEAQQTRRPSKKEPESSTVLPGVKKESSGREIITGVLLSARVTEKSASLARKNKYVFLVNPYSNKLEIARAVQGRYGVRCETVNVLNSPGKERHRGKQKGWKPGFKKAVVTLKEGYSIEAQ